ncbi:MAG TPA: glycosyltransferase [Dermatophilaceae bacterium]|nr:glycosyltransferase [Dermatophilaceae bacterium]
MADAFSLLLPVYGQDQPQLVRRAFRSSVQEQVRRPAEVVLVQDGAVDGRLASALDDLESDSPVPVRRVRLSRSVGLAQALQSGLAACEHDIVARMDADDVSLPDRFARQVPLLEGGVDLVGSALVEIGADEAQRGLLRIPPLTHEAIARQARWRSPFNHPTVVYRRSAVLAAGGYRQLSLMEDYWLFARMIAGGARTANLAEPLVLYRVGAGAYERRGGLRLLRSEVQLQFHLYGERFLSGRELVRNLLVRGGYRLTPVALRRAAYRSLLTTRADEPGDPVTSPPDSPPPGGAQVRQPVGDVGSR